MDQNNFENNSIQSFSVAAMVFGIFALLSCITGILPLFLGSLSILFVVLSHRKGSPIPALSRWGILLSCAGIALGVGVLVITYYTLILPLQNDPEFYETMDLYYRTNYGISLDQLFGESFLINQ